jgi:hypothetical protein
MAQEGNDAGRNGIVANPAEGAWLFEKAECEIYRHGDTSNPIEVKIINHADSIDSLAPPFDAIFRSVEIYGKQITCVMGMRYGNRHYRLTDNELVLIPEPGENTENEEQSSNIPEKIPVPAGYAYEANGNKLQFTMKYSYGSSQYKFPLSGILKITLTKQENR